MSALNVHVIFQDSSRKMVALHMYIEKYAT